RSRDSRAAAKARHATSALQLITAPASTLTRAAYAATGRIPAEEIDLHSPSMFDGATARPAQLSPDKRCRLPRAPQSDLRTHVVDMKACAPYLEHACYSLQRRRRPSESIKSGPPYRVDRHHYWVRRIFRAQIGLHPTRSCRRFDRASLSLPSNLSE